MNMHGCYACGQAIPRLVFADGGKVLFQCTRCGVETKPAADLDEAARDWNEGSVYTGEKFWGMVLDLARESRMERG